MPADPGYAHALAENAIAQLRKQIRLLAGSYSVDHEDFSSLSRLVEDVASAVDMMATESLRHQANGTLVVDDEDVRPPDGN